MYFAIYLAYNRISQSYTEAILQQYCNLLAFNVYLLLIPAKISERYTQVVR